MKKTARMIALLLCLAMALTLAGCGKSKNAQAADDLIDAIGTVTVDSKDAVEAAESAYAALTEKEQSQVEHAAELTAAREALDLAIKVRAAEDAIQALGEITLDSKAALDAIDLAIAALPAAEQDRLRGSETLTKAKEDLAAAVRAAEMEARRQSLLGVWTWQQDVTDMFITGMASQLAVASELKGLEFNVSDYFDSCVLGMTLELRDDGTYQLYCAEDSMRETIDSIKPGLNRMVRDLLVQLLGKQLNDSGVSGDFSTLESLEAALGMTLDEVIKTSMGVSLDAYIGLLLDESISMEDLLRDAYQDGVYAVELSEDAGSDQNRLYLSVGDNEINPESCELFRLGDGTLEILGHVGQGQFEGIYPVAMTKKG